MFKKNYHLYIDMPIIPVSTVSKSPLVKEWQKSTSDKNEEYAERFPHANIGLLTGEPSGIVAVDIDKEEAISLVPLSPISKKGKKGETRFFKFNGEKASKDSGIGIEILSTGNQTIIPPSIHPETGLPYQWLRYECNFDELPYLDPEFLSKIQNNKSQTAITPSDGRRCNHGSHTKLSEMLVAGLHANDTVEKLSKTLLDYDEKINPEFSYFICPSRKWKTNNRIVNANSFIIEAMLRHSDLVKPQVHFEVIELEPEIELEIDYKKEKLPKFRGVAQEIFDYIYRTSPIPRTRFAVASTIATMGTILSNRYCCAGFHPNFYVLIATISGGGKDRPLRVPYEIFNEAGHKDIIGGSPESDTGILMGLDIQDTRLDVFDEASRLFYMMGDTKNLYASKMADQYNILYTSAGKFFSGKTLKSGKIGECFSPGVNLLCALTFEDLKKSFTTSLMDKGVASRFLFFPDTEYKDLTKISNEEVPPSILDFCNNIRGPIEDKTINFKKRVNPKALHITEKMRDYCLHIANKYRREGKNNHPNLQSIYNRAIEIITKMAILDSLSQYNRDELTSDSLEWAINWYDIYIVSLSRFFDDNMFSTSQQRSEQEIFNLVRCKKNITTRDILRSAIGQKLNLQSKSLKIILDDLIEKDMINVQKGHSKNGRNLTLVTLSENN